MSPLDVERLLWELSAEEYPRQEDAQNRIPNDETLRAFRDGELSEADAKEVEISLAANQTARERLAAVAGVELPEPRLELREKVLDRHFPPVQKLQPRRRWTAVAALAAAAMLALVVSYPLLQTPSLPPDLSYDVALVGLASERSALEEEKLARAFPETRVRIRVEPKGASADGVDMGIYRQERGKLTRLPTTVLQLEMTRGAGAFEALARDLVGPIPGTYSFYIVVAERDDLPAEVQLSTGETSLEALKKGTRRRVYPKRLQMESPLTGNGSRKERGK